MRLLSWESVRFASKWPLRYRRFAGVRTAIAGVRHWIWRVRDRLTAASAEPMTASDSTAGVAVDVLELAYEAFQTCRHAGTAAEASGVVNLLVDAMRRARQRGTLVVGLSAAPFRYTSRDAWVAAGTGPWSRRVSLNRVSPRSRRLLSFVETAANELRRLCTSDSLVAIRSLGYALHNMPHLIRADGAFRPEEYVFCLRIVAFRWFDLSLEMRDAFCDLMDIERADIDRLANVEGFAIDMFGHSKGVREGVPERPRS